MKSRFLIVFACLGAAWAQSGQPAAQSAPPPPPLPDLPDSEVVAVFEDGAKFTMGDFKRIYSVLPAANQQMALRNRKLFMEQWAFMRRLAQVAEKNKLDQTSPVKDQLDYYRLMILSQAQLNQSLNTIPVEQAEIEKAYQASREKYKQVKVQAIYVAFGGTPAPGKPAVTEGQAKAKAERLLAEIRSGADFVKLVKDNSDDETSRAKNGDFATLTPADNVPDAIREVIFKLKQGDVGGPVRQSGGFYLLRAAEVTYKPLDQVSNEIFMEVRQDKSKQWLDRENQASHIEFTNATFAGEGVTIPLNAAPQPPAKP